MDSWPVEAPRGPSSPWGTSALPAGDEESDWENDSQHCSRPLPPLSLPPSLGPEPSTLPSTSASASPIASLDDGALHHVLGFLDPVSLSAVGAANRRMRELVNDPLSDRGLWKSFYSQRWSPSDASEPAATKGATAPWSLRYSRRLADAAALGAPRRPFADLLPGGHRGPVRAAAFASGVLSTGGADRRIRLWDLRCNNSNSKSGGGGGGRGGYNSNSRPCAASGELLAASAPLPGSVRCLAASSGLLVSGSGVDARLAVWRQRREGGGGGGGVEEDKVEAHEGEEREEEEEGVEDDSDDFDDDEDDRSLSSVSSSSSESDDEQGDNSAPRSLCSAARRLRLEESGRRRRRRKSRQAAATAAAARGGGGGAKKLPPPPFDLSIPPAFLSGHAGPVAAVSVEEGLIYSASWDMTVRVWDPDRKRAEVDERGGGDETGNGENGDDGRKHSNSSTTFAPASPPPPSSSTTSPHCVGVVHLCDWGWSVAPRAGRLLVAEGRGAAVFDAETGKLLRRVAPSEADGVRRGDAARVEGTRDGRTLLVARADGSLEGVDLRSRRSGSGTTTTTLLLPGGPPPSGLAFDDPWIALASGRGGVALLDARRPRATLATFSAAGRGKGKAAAGEATLATAATKPVLPIPRPPRRLGWSSNAAVRCVEISGLWIVGGCDDGSVRTWWFGGGGDEGGRSSRRRGRRGA